MKNYKSLLSKVVAIAMVVAMSSMLSISASAYEGTTSSEIMPRIQYSTTATYSGDFDEAWQLEKEEDFLTGQGNWITLAITYGYNTVLINEDYCWAYCDDSTHWAKLSNGTTHEGPIALPGRASKIEVQHRAASRYSYSCYLP